ncbi:MAG: nucleotidyltransferase domain-containing protein [Nanoarchaeota archaeon]
MDKNKLVSYAMNFASFLVDRLAVDNIILFGSVANNTFDKESDIDLFIETNKNNEKVIKNILDLYKKTDEYKKFNISGIKNEFSLKVGNLKEWKGLEASIISDGIVLYGHFQSQPNKLVHKRLFMLNLNKIDRKTKIMIWRKLYGYKQKVGSKTYNSLGLIDKKLGRGAFIVNIENSPRVTDFLKQNKINYSFFDTWTE